MALANCEPFLYFRNSGNVLIILTHFLLAAYRLHLLSYLTVCISIYMLQTEVGAGRIYRILRGWGSILLFPLTKGSVN